MKSNLISLSPQQFGEDVQFLPWIGRNYGTGGLFGRRVLVLGESHYQWQEGDVYVQPSRLNREFTRKCIQERIDGKKNARFWPRVQTIVGGPQYADDTEAFWHAVAFYNYVQGSVGTYSKERRSRPSLEQWQESQAPFDKVLALLKPERVVVCGCQLWENLHTFGDEYVRGKRGLTGLCCYRLPGGSPCFAVAIPHPSWPGSKNSLHEPLRSFIVDEQPLP